MYHRNGGGLLPEEAVPSAAAPSPARMLPVWELADVERPGSGTLITRAHGERELAQAHGLGLSRLEAVEHR